MSDTKREQLIAEGKLNPDGSRKQACPTCGTAVGETLTQEAYDAARGEVAEVVPNELAATPGGEATT